MSDLCPQAYTLQPQLRHFQQLRFVRNHDEEFIHLFNGSSLREGWPEALPVRVFTNYSATLGDCPYLAPAVRALIFSQHAVDRLGDLLESKGELLPLKCSEELPQRYYAYNVTRVTNALDPERSAYQYFPSGQVMNIKPIFAEGQLEKESIFLLPDLPKGKRHVTRAFAERVLAEGLEGFDLQPVGPSTP